MALSGDGGDELFGGYPGYRIVRVVHRATAGLSPTSRRLTADAVDGLVAGRQLDESCPAFNLDQERRGPGP